MLSIAVVAGTAQLTATAVPARAADDVATSPSLMSAARNFLGLGAATPGPALAPATGGASPLGQPTIAGPAAATAGMLPAPGPQPVAQGASLSGDAQRTRFAAVLSKAVSVNVFTLADPYRVIIELPQVNFQLPQGLGAQGLGLVKGYQYGLFAAGKSRIVLAVTGPVLVEKTHVTDSKAGQPAQLSLELVPTDRITFMAGSSRQLVASAAGGTPLKLGRAPLAADKRPTKEKKPIIVIDPGHGGKDPGATKTGAIVKDVVLAFGLMLRDKLKATGRYEILMTRDNDRFVELDERRDFARRHGAALFMAIHADSAPGGANVRGATIYSLRQSVAKGLARSAGRGGSGGDVLAGVELEETKGIPESSPQEVKSILADFADREKARSNKGMTDFFANGAIRRMGESTQVTADSHREAAFRVLVTGEVPSVLIELAYVTNRQDAANLKSDEWRDQVSTSLVGAVNGYFNVARLPL